MTRFMWLVCEIGDGLFPDERAVSIQAADGMIAFFAAQSKLKQSADPRRGTVRVEVLDYDENFGLVELPSPIIGGSNTAKVSRTALTLQ